VGVVGKYSIPRIPPARAIIRSGLLDHLYRRVVALDSLPVRRSIAASMRVNSRLWGWHISGGTIKLLTAGMNLMPRTNICRPRTSPRTHAIRAEPVNAVPLIAVESIPNYRRFRPRHHERSSRKNFSIPPPRSRPMLGLITTG